MATRVRDAISPLCHRPLLRQYYLAWVLPAIVLLASAAWSHASMSGRMRTPARIGLTVWLIGMALWAWQPARLYGAHLLILIVLAALLLWLARVDDQQRKPTNLRSIPE